MPRSSTITVAADSARSILTLQAVARAAGFLFGVGGVLQQVPQRALEQLLVAPDATDGAGAGAGLAAFSAEWMTTDLPATSRSDAARRTTRSRLTSAMRTVPGCANERKSSRIRFR